MAISQCAALICLSIHPGPACDPFLAICFGACELHLEIIKQAAGRPRAFSNLNFFSFAFSRSDLP